MSAQPVYQAHLLVDSGPRDGEDQREHRDDPVVVVERHIVVDFAVVVVVGQKFLS